MDQIKDVMAEKLQDYYVKIDLSLLHIFSQCEFICHTLILRAFDSHCCLLVLNPMYEDLYMKKEEFGGYLDWAMEKFEEVFK